MKMAPGALLNKLIYSSYNCVINLNALIFFFSVWKIFALFNSLLLCNVIFIMLYQHYQIDFEWYAQQYSTAKYVLISLKLTSTGKIKKNHPFPLSR